VVISWLPDRRSGISTVVFAGSPAAMAGAAATKAPINFQQMSREQRMAGHQRQLVQPELPPPPETSAPGSICDNNENPMA
jgi:hypothetical protein